MDGGDPFLPSECSSGCESGWTMYLDHSYEKPTSLSSKEITFQCKNSGFVAEEEDMSMVSDASSPSPYFHEDDQYCDENGCFCSASSAALVKKNDKRRRVETEAVEENTASSHVFSLSKKSSSLTNKQESMENVLDISIGFSATHFKAKSVLHKQYDSHQTSQPLKPNSAKTVCKKESRGKIW